MGREGRGTCGEQHLTVLLMILRSVLVVFMSEEAQGAASEVTFSHVFDTETPFGMYTRRL